MRTGNRVSAIRRILWIVALLFVAGGHLGSGCEPECGDSCASDDDCGSDLVCHLGQCAPRECRLHCGDEDLSICLFDPLTCKYLDCD